MHDKETNLKPQLKIDRKRSEHLQQYSMAALIKNNFEEHNDSFLYLKDPITLKHFDDGAVQFK
jgi:hypothetical protein